jgi:hypothetical protein
MKTLTLKTSVGGRFNIEDLRHALESHGPFEPETEYEISVHVAKLGEGTTDIVSPRRALTEEGPAAVPVIPRRRPSTT